MNSVLRALLLSAILLCAGVVSATSSAQGLSDPNFQFVFDQFIEGTGGVHTDIQKIIVGKPVSSLFLSMKSSGNPASGNMHLSGSEILLDLSGAFVFESTNTASELSVSALFSSTPLPVGEYLATKVVFGFSSGFFHDTTGLAFGQFSDGQSFEVEVFAGFVPEPSSAVLFLVGATCLLSLTALRTGRSIRGNEARKGRARTSKETQLIN